MRSSTPTTQGFIVSDMIVGMVIVALLAIILAAVSARAKTANASMLQTRTALHLAEHALLNLQHGQPIPPITDDTHLTLIPAKGGSAPAGFTWAKVDASIHGRHQSLIGIVPAGSIQPTGAKP